MKVINSIEKINATHTYFLVVCEDNSWSCAKKDKDIRNIDILKKIAQVKFQKKWYLAEILSSSDKRRDIMRRGMRLENSDYLEISDADQVKHVAPSSQKTSIGIHFDLY